MADQELQDRIRETGERIFDKLGGDRPSAFRPDYWSGRMIEWSLGNPTFKTQLFRFVDVLPSLRSSEAVARHVREYFGDQDLELSGMLKWGASILSPGSLGAKALSRGIESQVRSMAGQFIVGERVEDAKSSFRKLRRQGAAFTVSLLGEAVTSEKEADDYAQRYLDALDGLGREAPDWPPVGSAGEADWGSAPRVNVSVKPSSLYSQFRPQAFQTSVAAAVDRLRPICREAVSRGASICLDMEERSLKALTLAIYRALLEDPEFEGWPHSGLALQTYYRDVDDDLEPLLEWSRERRQPFTVRLIKGAYWDMELVHAQQENWPVPVWTRKPETDVAFEKAARRILEHAPDVRLACGSHNIRSIAYVAELSRELDVPPDRVEYQLLYGMADPIVKALLEMEFPVRVYCPVGELVPGMAYLVRRLLENTSNESFLRRSFADGPAPRDELRDPIELLGAHPPTRDEAATKRAAVFQNEPLLDWTLADVRSRFERALGDVRGRFPIEVPIAIGGRERNSSERFTSTNPNRTAEQVATVHLASREHVGEAVQAARDAFPGWRDTPPDKRADILMRAAEEARRRRFELAALQVFEAGKAWEEADADVCEAIDFLEYYARQMRRLGVPQELGNAPGEDSRLVYEPRGVAAVIAPWNFPMAISTGMSSAAIVTGNTVVYKPSSETAAIGFEIARIFESAGLPPGVFNLLPGAGREVGGALAAHPEVRLIAFTGSREVGLEILRRAAEPAPGARWIKQVIAEMGGKNAIIVDDDADWDEAIAAVVHSAFGYQGQKCSACSRLILLDSIHDPFLERLSEAVESLPLGPVENPAYKLGAVISSSALEKIEKYVALGEREVRTVLKRRYEGGSGHFPPVAVFADVPPDHALAQEEIFGPVLSVIRARDFDAALDIAYDTDYALTGAVFSRSPANLEQARKRFRVGNLYINRGSTHALVQRHPFGGFKMSGVGTKAGGPDYLRQFVVPRTIVENTTRRGFTPGME